MSYYGMTDSMYRPPPAGTPGWQLAPVPGWGMNPERAGPPIIATNGTGDQYRTMTDGHVAMAAAGGMFVGWWLAYVYFRTNKKRA